MKSIGAVKRELRNVRGIIAIRKFSSKPTEKLEAAEWTLRWMLKKFHRQTTPTSGFSTYEEIALMKELRK